MIEGSSAELGSRGFVIITFPRCLPASRSAVIYSFGSPYAPLVISNTLRCVSLIIIIDFSPTLYYWGGGWRTFYGLHFFLYEIGYATAMIAFLVLHTVIFI